MLFKSNFSEQCLEDVLYLYEDESIIPKNSGDWVLYFGGCWFALSINKKTGRVINFEGYSSNFLPSHNMKIPVSKKGAIYFSAIFDGDGAYLPEDYGFKSEGYYDLATGWFRVGEEFKSGEVVEIATDTLINLEEGKLKAIYFKPQKAKE